MVFVSVSSPFVSTLLSHVVVMINDAPFLIVLSDAADVVVVVSFCLIFSLCFYCFSVFFRFWGRRRNVLVSCYSFTDLIVTNLCQLN